MTDRVSRPPITQELAQENGRPGLAWAKWFDRVFSAINDFGGLAVYSCEVTFAGQGSNGSAPILAGYNIESVSRTGVGVYVCTVSRETAYQAPLISEFTRHVVNFSAPAFAYDFSVELSAPDQLTLSVYRLEQGAGVTISRVLSDPSGVGESVSVALITRISDLVLPA